ncbi:superoxide dismutase [Cu-Zn] [Citricoccus zhacaiensis]|uniref:Superoxide dismutase [Cu-Zn] n=1 Tax=Citricoccus zhacaiensis TaxID=489142 RepID=A0ABQ2LS48_9MICC|nr:superoxide dismutase family protein [Citricoccus zhacaiensis]GGO42514.1 superoxide dismutase [Cu-Zn] [Citricoccus zhacaiensis]
MLQQTARKTTLIRTTTALLGLGGMLALGACGGGGDVDATPAPVPEAATPSVPADDPEAPGSPDESPGMGAEGAGAAFTATLQDIDGGELVTAEISDAEGMLEFTVDATGMEPGFYGLHVHAIGECEPDSAAPDDPEDTGAFKSAGGHIGSEDSDHPDHAGDLPTLLVQESGDAHLTFQTDRLSAEDFEDEDGAALMVHSEPDNYANVPERYAPDGPDEDTTGTGDAGDRLACGVIEPAS